MIDHTGEIAARARSTRRWTLPLAVLVIAAIIPFLVVRARPDP
jgi:hypothetical protein